MIVPRPVLRAYWAFHKVLDRLSGGRLSTVRPTDRRLGVLFLTTIGHQSGKARRTALYFVQDGPRFVVASSNAGAEAEPAWWRNLQAHPEAIVDLRGRGIPVRARQAAPEEQARLWPEFVRRDGTFAEYERATAREIAVVILEPRPSGDS
jgi:deazaflavin-dependent oxidoreductase (nitroreductase family)